MISGNVNMLMGKLVLLHFHIARHPLVAPRSQESKNRERDLAFFSVLSNLPVIERDPLGLANIHGALNP